MLSIPSPACPHCGRPLKLDQAIVRVPYRRTHWWQFGDERAEYRCQPCSGFSVLRLSRTGAVLYSLELVALAAAWQSGLSRAGILGAGAMLGVILYRHAVKLVAS